MKNEQSFIYVPSGEFGWAKTHAQIPTFYETRDGKWRIYYTTRNEKGISNISFIEIDSGNPAVVTYIHNSPLLPLGNFGSFDEDGIMMSSLVRDGDKLLLYYTGWNKKIGANYTIAMGLAVSYDDGISFKKLFDGPIADRDIYDPIFSAMPCVIKQGNLWKMWYISCTEWKLINNNPEPVYLVKYAESQDGIIWGKNKDICIDYKYDGEAIGRPSVIIEDGIYKMWYSTRGSVNYRTDKNNSYKIGYAESQDGIKWQRMDDKINIPLANSGWDSEMMCYCNIVKIHDKKYMFYNGNTFGKTGVGYKIL